MSAGGEARRALLETRLYAASPLPPLATTGLLAALLFAGYAGVCAVFDAPLLDSNGLRPGAQIALIMSLLVATALDLPERARRIWAHEADALKATLGADGAGTVDGLAVGQPARITGSIWIWFAAGALGGLIFNALIIAGSGDPLAAYLASPTLWALIVAPVLFGLGGRAIRMMSEDDRAISRLVESHLIVDFADLDRLHVYGRVGLRSALIWMVMAALVLAFLAVQASAVASAISFALSVAAALWAMLSVTRPVAAKVEAEKSAALLQARREIMSASRDSSAETGRIADLVAYEAWLEKRPAWPVSAPVTRRLALYGLIPVLAWFGAAAAELVVEALA
jgi:hypothetical protein